MSEIRLDPNFFLPDGLVGVGYEVPLETDPQIDGPPLRDEVIDMDDGTSIPDDNENYGNEAAFPTPTNIIVQSQTLRTAKDGSSTVDIIIEFDSVDGAVEYELRLAR